MSEIYRSSIEIFAEPDRVFENFVRPELTVRWMGDRARLEARDGGVFAVDINGVIMRGHFVRVERPHLIEIAWAEAGNDAMPKGSTRLLLRFSATRGTPVELEHHGLAPEAATRSRSSLRSAVGRSTRATHASRPRPSTDLRLLFAMATPCH